MRASGIYQLSGRVQRLAAGKRDEEGYRASGRYLLQACVSGRRCSRASAVGNIGEDLLGGWSGRTLSTCLRLCESQRSRSDVLLRRLYRPVRCVRRGYGKADQAGGVGRCDRAGLWAGGAGVVKAEEKRQLQCDPDRSCVWAGAVGAQGSIRDHIWTGKKWIKDWRWVLCKGSNRE